MFTGLTYCHCGKKMYVRTTSPKYVCQSCWNKIAIMDLEAVFHEQLKGFFVSSKEVVKHIEKADEHLQEKQKVLDVLVADQTKVDEEVKRIYGLYTENEIDGAGFGRLYKPLQDRQTQLEEELPRLQAEVDLLKINQLSADHIINEAKDLYGRWPSLTREEKRSVIDSITDKIVIGKDEVSINLCHLESSEELTKEQRTLYDGEVAAGIVV